MTNEFKHFLESNFVGVSRLFVFSLQGSTNCVHGDEHARNMHTNRFLCVRNYVHVNQSKHL